MQKTRRSGRPNQFTDSQRERSLLRMKVHVITDKLSGFGGVRKPVLVISPVRVKAWMADGEHRARAVQEKARLLHPVEKQERPTVATTPLAGEPLGARSSF